MLKFKCLILDHDDTVVNSTGTIHYPSFIEYLKVKRPGRVKDYTMELFIEKNFIPGIVSLFADELHLTDAEMQEEQLFWENFVETRVPTAYAGIRKILTRFREEGGIIAVVSHSMTRYIERDYRENGLPAPDAIYGWDLPRDKRKPSPYAIEDLCKRYNLTADDIIVVDDLKPGFDMARAGGVYFAAAGWAYNVPLIKAFMQEHSDAYLSTVSELSPLLFEDA
jgi:phosphoglycolate phosphatase/pyrophosphatase PpaX